LKTKYSKTSGTGSRKNPKTLSGIETKISTRGRSGAGKNVGKTLKPYQGLKPYGIYVGPSRFRESEKPYIPI
jgi:hypothetical protein